MKLPLRQIAQGIFAVGSIACFVAAMHYMHRSGCADAVKRGSFGGIERAMALESIGIRWGLASSVLLAILAASFPGRSTLARVAISVGVGVVAFILFLGGGVHVQMKAIQSCL